MLWKCCNQIASKFGKLCSGHRTEKYVFIPIPKKGNAKECKNYPSIAVISHTGKVMLKILQVWLQQYVNWDLPDVQAGFRKGRGTRDQIATIHRIIEKQESSRKTSTLLYWLCQNLWLCGPQQTVENSSRDGYTTSLLAPWEICIQVKKQQLELDMEQQTGPNWERSM